MRKEFRVRYKKADNFYGFVTTDGENLTDAHAKNRAIDFLEANGIAHLGIDEIYEIDSDGNRVFVEPEYQEPCDSCGGTYPACIDHTCPD